MAKQNLDVNGSKQLQEVAEEDSKMWEETHKAKKQSGKRPTNSRVKRIIKSCRKQE